MSKRRLTDRVPNFEKSRTSVQEVPRIHISNIPDDVISGVIVPFIPRCYYYHLKRVNKYFYEMSKTNYLKKNEGEFDEMTDDQGIIGYTGDEDVEEVKARDPELLKATTFSLPEFYLIKFYIEQDDAKMLGNIWMIKHLKRDDFATHAIENDSLKVLKFFWDIGQEFPKNFFEMALSCTEATVRFFMNCVNTNVKLKGKGLIRNGHFELFKELIDKNYIPMHSVLSGSHIETAAKSGSLEMIQWFLQKGSNIREKFFINVLSGKNPSNFEVLLQKYLLFHKFKTSEDSLKRFLFAAAKNSAASSFEYITNLAVAKSTFMKMDGSTKEVADRLLHIIIEYPDTTPEIAKVIVTIFGRYMKLSCTRTLKDVVKHFGDNYVVENDPFPEIYIKDMQKITWPKIELLLREKIITLNGDCSLENFVKDFTHNDVIPEKFDLISKLSEENIISFENSRLTVMLKRMIDQYNNYDFEHGDNIIRMLDACEYNCNFMTVFGLVDNHLTKVKFCVEAVSDILKKKKAISPRKVLRELFMDAPNIFSEFVGVLNFLVKLFCQDDHNARLFLAEQDPIIYKNVSEKIFNVFPKYRADFLLGLVHYDDLSMIREYYRCSKVTSHICKELEGQIHERYISMAINEIYREFVTEAAKRSKDSSILEQRKLLFEKTTFFFSETDNTKL